jgi:uncharacterized protein
MDEQKETFVQGDRRLTRPSIAIAAFTLLAVAALEYVKWGPSWHRLKLIAAGGNMGGSILSAGGNADVSLQAASTYALAYGRDIWKALVLGLLLGTSVQALIPSGWVSRLFGGTGYRGVSAASLIAVPSMMCTCCAAPVAVGFRRAGASTRATLAYWLANPMLNPATLILIGMMLGWKWLALRSMLGVLLVFGGSYLVAGSTETDRIPTSAPVATDGPFTSELGSEQSMGRRWFAEFRRLSISLIPEYIILIVLLGAARGWLFPHPLEGEPNTYGSWAMPLLTIEGLSVLGEQAQAAALYPLVLELIATGAVCLAFISRFPQTIAGLAAAAAERWNDAEQHFQIALRQTRDFPHLVELAETRRFYGGMLIERGRPKDREKARALLKQASDTYKQVGMPRHTAIVENLLNKLERA